MENHLCKRVCASLEHLRKEREASLGSNMKVGEVGTEGVEILFHVFIMEVKSLNTVSLLSC